MQHGSPQNWHGLLVHRSTCNTQRGAGFESGVQYQVVGDDSDDVQGKCITYARECVSKFGLAPMSRSSGVLPAGCSPVLCVYSVILVKRAMAM